MIIIFKDPNRLFDLLEVKRNLTKKTFFKGALKNISNVKTYKPLDNF